MASKGHTLAVIRYVRRKKARGVCSVCTQPLTSACHCERHRIDQNRRGRQRRAELGAPEKFTTCRACDQPGHNIATCWRRKELSRADWERIVREKARVASRISTAKKRAARLAFLSLLAARAGLDRRPKRRSPGARVGASVPRGTQPPTPGYIG